MIPDGANGDDMVVPPSYQVAAPFGAHIGGVNPVLATMMASAAQDSWLTVSMDAAGNNANALASIGIDFTIWTDTDGIIVNDGAVFYLDPTSAPLPDANNSTLIAQLTVSTGSRFLLACNAQGQSVNANDADWATTGLYFTYGSAWVGNCWAERFTHCGVPCALGTSDLDNDGTTACIHCRAGTYAGVNATSCEPCSPGSYDDDSDPATPCLSCPAGRTSAAGAMTCELMRCYTGLLVDNSNTICAGRVGDTCTYTCNAGYVVGPTHSCGNGGADGSAAFSGGSCTPLSCDGALSPLDGTTGCGGSIPLGDSCEYQCADPAMRPLGVRSCGADGLLTGGACEAYTACTAAEAATCPTGSSCGAGTGQPVCTCAPGMYATSYGTGTQTGTAAGTTSASGCSAVASCVLGTQFEQSAPSESADRVCSDVANCALGDVASVTATMKSDTVCVGCAPGTFASAPGVCDVCVGGTYDDDSNSSTPCAVTNEAVSVATFATVAGAISEGDFIAAAAAASGAALDDVQVVSYVQTVALSASMPGQLSDWSDLRGAAAAQFSNGVATAAGGLSPDAVTITGVTGNRRRAQTGTGVAVTFTIESHEDISGVVTGSGWSSAVATSVNDAGGGSPAITSVSAAMFAPVSVTDIGTAVTFAVVGTLDATALSTEVAAVSTATVTVQPTAILAASIPPECSPGQELSVDRTGCVPCPVGQADLDSVGATPCIVCPVGTQALGGGRACAVCPADVADTDLDPATACEKPHIVSTSVVLDGAADRMVVRNAVSSTTQIHQENVEYVSWVEGVDGAKTLNFLFIENEKLCIKITQTRGILH